MAFHVLCVCTANICRSAMAEQLFRAGLAGRHDVTVASAGLQALAGHGIDDLSAAALAELGVDRGGAHVARQLSAASVDAADLVLAATSDQRSQVVQLVPLAFRRAFTLREFGRLGAGLPTPADTGPDGLRRRVAEVAGQRGLVDPAPPGADEIGDPFGAPYAQMQRCALTVRDAVTAALRVLGTG